MTDQDVEKLLDADTSEKSTCCGAKVMSGFCMDCKEHA